ncbi:hypothetical protein [Mycolicibacterium austroafricanum]|uniref:hypothetical protein n=1 Tax=Mycolicibacterium austroafricanum TaxID=39687 RepID=UPI001ABF97A2|nr:hypothetical protein [Mycolicibacterium austroafricanum]QRZ05922.1 hypothetical protein JN090_23840 [Mycolicibacterium austroafricanum]
MSWDSVEDAGRDAVGWSLVADYAKHRYESARTFIADKLQGSRGIDVEVGGRVIGGVSRPQAKDAPDVTDDAAFLAYVMDNHPDAIRVESRWQSNYVKRLQKVDTDDGIVFVDKQTGLPVPGVGMVRTNPYWKVTKDHEAKQEMYELLGRVTPTVEGFRALPEPESRWEQDTTAGAIGGTE